MYFAVFEELPGSRTNVLHFQKILRTQKLGFIVQELVIHNIVLFTKLLLLPRIKYYQRTRIVVNQQRLEYSEWGFEQSTGDQFTRDV